METALKTWVEATLAGGSAGLDLIVSQSGKVLFEHKNASLLSTNNFTEPIVAAGIMLLVEQRLIDLQAPLSTYLPQISPSYANITTNQLLTRTSGIPNNTKTQSATGELLFAPGECWSPDSFPLHVFDDLVRAITKQSLDDFVGENVLGKLDVREERTSCAAFFKLASMLQRRGLGLNDERVLAEDTVKQMLGNQLTKFGISCNLYDLAPELFSTYFGYGYGGKICIRKTPACSSRITEFSNALSPKTGDGDDASLFWVDQRNELVVVLVIAPFAAPAGLAGRIWEELHAVINGALSAPVKPLAPPPSKPVEFVSSNPKLELAIKQWLDETINSGKLTCGEIAISQASKMVVSLAKYSTAAPETGGNHKQQAEVFRMYGLTKPIVVAAFFTMVEQGKIDLAAPVHKYLGSAWRKENLRVIDAVATAQNNGQVVTTPCLREITMHHLLTNTSGLSQGLSSNLADQYYEKMGISATVIMDLKPDEPGQTKVTLDQFLRVLSTCPLLFQPGEGYVDSYQMELLVKVMQLRYDADGTGGGTTKRMEDILQETVCAKLDMTSTRFFITPVMEQRLCGLINPRQAFPLRFPYESGSGGLFSTLEDYFKFTSMLARKGLGLNGVRILEEATVKQMLRNALPGTLADIAQPQQQRIPNLFASERFGFAYGGGKVCVAPDPADVHSPVLGEFSMAISANNSSMFWIDPRNDLVVVFLSAFLRGRINVWEELHRVVYANIDMMPEKAPSPVPSPFPLKSEKILFEEEEERKRNKLELKDAVTAIPKDFSEEEEPVKPPPPLRSAAFCGAGNCVVV